MTAKAKNETKPESKPEAPVVLKGDEPDPNHGWTVQSDTPFQVVEPTVSVAD